MIFFLLCPLLDFVQADVIEVNRVYADDGSLQLEQVIFWEWNQRHSRYDVLDWRYLRETDLPSYRNGYWQVTWWDDRRRACVLKVRARQVRWTWTFYDVEVAERKKLRPRQRKRINR